MGSDACNGGRADRYTEKLPTQFLFKGFMPTSEQPLNRGAVADVAELRALREEAENIRAEVATLHGRLDVIEVVLRRDKAPGDISG